MNNRLLNYNSWNTDLATLMIRLMFGCLFASYGYMKISNYDMMLSMFGDPIGLGPKLSLNLVIFAEFFCGIFIALGFLTRLSVIPVLITMLVVYFVTHAKDPFMMTPGKQIVFVYGILCLPIFILGSGKYSVDAFIFKNKK